MKRVKVVILILMVLMIGTIEARIKLVALPERDTTIIRLDNPKYTLVEEERVLTLQKGINKVDFSWKGVSVDSNSIRIQMLSHPQDVNLISVSFPPNEAALVWSIFSKDAYEERVRISYLLSGIDRLITYKAFVNKGESKMNLKSYLVLRNFSGEDFNMANVKLNYGEAFEKGILNEETKSMLFFKKDKLGIKKVFTFDAAKLPWEPKEMRKNVGIPVTYEVKNTAKNGLGKFALWNGKARIYQDDGHKSTIFLGEDNVKFTPVGGKMNLHIGDSRDIVVSQYKIKEEKINIRRNRPRWRRGRIILYDTDEVIKVKIENFKDKEATVTLIEHIPGEWEMKKCKEQYKKKDANTIEFNITVGPKKKKVFTFNYNRRNVR